MRGRSALLLALLPAVAACARAAEVREPERAAPRSTTRHAVSGQVVLEGVMPALARIDVDPAQRAVCGHETHPDPTCAVGRGRGVANCVVELRPVGGEAPPRLVPDARIAKRPCAFEPRVRLVAPGQRARFRNEGGRDPYVRGLGFEVLLRAGAEESVVFRGAGAHAVEGDERGTMRGYVYVVSSAHAAVTDADGGFRMPNVPAGDYVAEVWHERIRRGAPVLVRVPLPKEGALRVPVALR